MNRKTCTIDGRECFISDSVRPQYILIQTLGDHERGYSLGGLFALWSAMQTDRFAAIAAASPSLWIKDWLNYAEAHPVQTGKVFLSLGDQEEHVKNRAIARVGDSVRDEYELLKAQLGNESCTLVWNPGNHFQDEDKRLAAAFSWCIKELEVK